MAKDSGLESAGNCNTDQVQIENEKEVIEIEGDPARID